MLCIQNSETWALSKPIQKPNQFIHQTVPVFTKIELLCPKNGACSSQKRSLFFPKTEPVLPKNGACSPQKRSMFFPKTELHNTCDRYPQRWQILPKSVDDVVDFLQNRWSIFPIVCKSLLKLDVCFDLFHAHGFSSQSRVSESPLICDETTQTSFGCIHVYNYLWCYMHQPWCHTHTT